MDCISLELRNTGLLSKGKRSEKVEMDKGFKHRLRNFNFSTLTPILFSSGITASLIFFISRTTSIEDWLSLFYKLNPSLLILYLLLFVVSMILRAFRYQLLLHVSHLQQKIGLYILILTTFVKNIFVDLLPARIGALSYVVLLNKKFKLPLPSCLSSFTLSIIFDFIGMVPLIFFGVVIGVGVTGKSDPLWFIPLSILILVVSYALFLYVDRFFYILIKMLSFFEEKKWFIRPMRLKGIKEVLDQTAYDINFAKENRIFWKTLILSVFIRVLKYSGLYILILSFLPQDDRLLSLNTSAWIFFGLIAAEASASLPISGIGGFGAYEWSLIAVLSTLGLGGTVVGVISLGLHLLTQIIDYLLGGVALSAALLYKRPDLECNNSFAQEDQRCIKIDFER